MNLKNYWISKLIIILGVFFLNSANADNKINASQQVSNFLNTIKEFASEKDSLIKIKRSDQLLDMVDLEFMSKVTVGKQWKTVDDSEKIIFKRKLFNKFIQFIDLHLEDFKEIKFQEKSIKLRGQKLVYVTGSIDTKKIKKLDITWKLSSKENKILDVEIEKISLIKTQKLEMRPLLKKNKNNFSQFIEIYFSN
ncbi:MAG: ABC transporter substrate-binding protein [Candidatus Puniceispirillales bacterium]